MWRSGLCLAAGFVLALAGCAPETPERALADQDLPDRVDYNFHIRPILSNNCFVCHGPDHSTREAGLRLDTYEDATARREEGPPAIVPGNAGRSRLVQRLKAEDPHDRMPPPEAKKTLASREVALIERWIEQGAEYKPHWSLLPPVPPQPPPDLEGWPAANPIDNYIYAALNERGLQPTEPASKEAQVRRLSYVLTGLPPPPGLVRDFIGDEAPDAYTRLVDRLLGSPRFGEHWARHWMDLARYADSRGHEFDYTIQGSWRYRDYLIRAFNDDVPYDRLILEQLAGDRLEQPRLNPEGGYNESALGTMFFVMGEGTHSPVDLRKDEADRIDNIIDVTSKTFQGLTVACARCHDHKFDPIPTADYYALYGVFESTRFASTPLLKPLHSALLDSLEAARTEVRRQIAGAWQEAYTDAVPARTTAFQIPGARDETTKDTSFAARMLGDFRGGGFDGWFPDGPAFGPAPAAGLPLFDEAGTALTGLAPGMATSRYRGKGVPGALRSPTFTIEEDTIAVFAAGHASSIRVVIDNFQLIRDPIYGGLEKVADGPAPRAYRFGVGMWKGRKAYLELLVGAYDKGAYISEQHLLRSDSSAYVEAAYAVGYIGTAPAFDANWTPTPDEAPAPANPSSEAVRSAIEAWGAGRADSGDVALLNAEIAAGHLPASIPEAAPALARLRGLEARFGPVDYFMGVTEGDAIDSPVFVRGNYKTLGEAPVPRRYLGAVAADAPAFHSDHSGRLAMARHIASEDNPLTARVMANRLWHHVFGTGLVPTTDNFGAQGQLPSHPALLDYLAVRFVEEGWSVKSMIRAMVCSNTFRQSTVPAPGAMEADPGNRLLHHYPVRRLEAESIRDAILAAAGRLDSTLYGPPVPVHLTPFMQGRGRPPETGPLDGGERRSLYLSIRRNFLPPMMLVFDMPIPFSTVGNRTSSNVPAQSLTLLNDPFTDLLAARWAGALLSRPASGPEERIAHIYWSALSRAPTPEETAVAVAFLDEQARQPGTAQAAAYEDAAAWKALCHVVFNMKEFIYLI